MGAISLRSGKMLTLRRKPPVTLPAKIDWAIEENRKLRHVKHCKTITESADAEEEGSFIEEGEGSREGL